MKSHFGLSPLKSLSKPLSKLSGRYTHFLSSKCDYLFVSCRKNMIAKLSCEAPLNNIFKAEPLKIPELHRPTPAFQPIFNGSVLKDIIQWNFTIEVEGPNNYQIMFIMFHDISTADTYIIKHLASSGRALHRTLLDTKSFIRKSCLSIFVCGLKNF